MSFGTCLSNSINRHRKAVHVDEMVITIKCYFQDEASPRGAIFLTEDKCHVLCGGIAEWLVWILSNAIIRTSIYRSLSVSALGIIGACHCECLDVAMNSMRTSSPYFIK
jgi:hypothetical protein